MIQIATYISVGIRPSTFEASKRPPITSLDVHYTVLTILIAARSLKRQKILKTSLDGEMLGRSLKRPKILKTSPDGGTVRNSQLWVKL